MRLDPYIENSKFNDEIKHLLNRVLDEEFDGDWNSLQRERSGCESYQRNLRDINSSPDFQALRKSMLEGKWDEPGCDNCKKKEEMGVKSQRQNWLVANHKKKFNFTADEAFSNLWL